MDSSQVSWYTKFPYRGGGFLVQFDRLIRFADGAGRIGGTTGLALWVISQSPWIVRYSLLCTCHLYRLWPSCLSFSQLQGVLGQNKWRTCCAVVVEPDLLSWGLMDWLFSFYQHLPSSWPWPFGHSPGPADLCWAHLLLAEEVCCAPLCWTGVWLGHIRWLCEVLFGSWVGICRDVWSIVFLLHVRNLQPLLGALWNSQPLSLLVAEVGWFSSVRYPQGTWSRHLSLQADILQMEMGHKNRCVGYAMVTDEVVTSVEGQGGWLGCLLGILSKSQLSFSQVDQFQETRLSLSVTVKFWLVPGDPHGLTRLPSHAA